MLGKSPKGLVRSAQFWDKQLESVPVRRCGDSEGSLAWGGEPRRQGAGWLLKALVALPAPPDPHCEFAHQPCGPTVSKPPISYSRQWA